MKNTQSEWPLKFLSILGVFVGLLGFTLAVSAALPLWNTVLIGITMTWVCIVCLQIWTRAATKSSTSLRK